LHDSFFTQRRKGAKEFYSRLRQRFDAVAVETFAGGKGFGSEAAVYGRFNAQHKLAAE
jgi:hypothetical protein